MTGLILAPAAPAVDTRPLSLTSDVPTLGRPPALPALLALTAFPHRHVDPVPVGVAAGPVDVHAVLDNLVPEIEGWRRTLAGLPTPGFLVTAADAQRAREVLRLLGEASAILAERA